MEIAQERLEREYDLSIVTTAPSVVYKVHKTNGEVVEIDNPANLPAAQYRDFHVRLFNKVSIITPKRLCRHTNGFVSDKTRYFY